MKKLMISSVLLMILVITAFGVMATNDANTAGFINGIEIKKQEVEIAKKDFEAYNVPSENSYSINESNQNVSMSDLDFLKAVAKRKLTEQLFIDNHITVSQKEINKTHAYFDEVMEIIYEQSNSKVEAEKQGGLMLLQCMKNAADVRGMTMDQYQNEVCKKEYEYMCKKDKLVKAMFSSAQELEDYLEDTVNKILKVKDINIE